MTPCPYHKPGADCQLENHCPLVQYRADFKCETLSPAQIRTVRAWVEGQVPEAE